MLEKRIRCPVSIDDMQSVFMPGKRTTIMFIMRQVQERHQTRKKKLYYAFVFVDLENAFSRVLTEEMETECYEEEI